jgi:hypothetical protein
VASLARGVDGEVWAWFHLSADAKRIQHVPLAELKLGCAL